MPISVVSQVVSNARVQNLATPQADEAFRGGVVLGTGDLEKRLRHNRAGSVADGFDPDAKYQHRIVGEWIYGGFIYPHFGHFMAEAVHRIVAARLIHPGVNFLFVGAWSPEPTSTMHQVPTALQDILRLLEIDSSNSIVVNQSAVVDCLYVVEQAADLGGAPKDGYLEALAGYIGDRIKSANAGCHVAVPEKLYVSRSKLPPGGAVLGESYIEEQIAASSVGIFHPEDHPFAEQLRHYVEARTVVFHEGSACHGTELLGAGMMGQVGLIVRRSEVGHSFDAILRPRAKSYAAFFDTVSPGSIVVAGDGGAPQRHLGVAVAAPAPMADFLRERFALPLEEFSPVEFLRRARSDLQRYCDFHRAHGAIAPVADVASFLENAHAVLDGFA